MKLSNWFGYPGQLEAKNMLLIADVLEKSADTSAGLAMSVSCLLELVTRLNNRLSVIEDILRQQGLAK